MQSYLIFICKPLIEYFRHESAVKAYEAFAVEVRVVDYAPLELVDVSSACHLDWLTICNWMEY